MTAIDLKAEITDMLKNVKDTSLLEQVKAYVHARLGKGREALDDFTPEELAELDQRRAARLSGKSKGRSGEAVIQGLRKAQA
ncbi:MAG TPA: hypothetical protein PKD45_14035 [Flavobacteriales bacterium]|nr:hypothetical protein [Flavobacteriales bacterium]